MPLTIYKLLLSLALIKHRNVFKYSCILDKLLANVLQGRKLYICFKFKTLGASYNLQVNAYKYSSITLDIFKKKTEEKHVIILFKLKLYIEECSYEWVGEEEESNYQFT